MQQKQMFKQMMDFNKASFNNAFSAMVMVQDQVERMVSMLLEQASWLPEDGKKAVGEWVKMCKKGREDYKKAVDEGYRVMEGFVSGAESGKTE
jgi:hypothetical protein